MNKQVKNIIAFLVIAATAGSIYFTMNHAKSHIHNIINNTIQKEDKNIPPTIPSEENTQKEAIPQKPNEDSQNNSQTPPQKPNENKPDTNNSPNQPVSNIKLTVGYYILFAAESFIISLALIYLILSNLSKKTFRIFPSIFPTIIVAAILFILNVYITNNYFLNSKQLNISNMNNNPSAIAAIQIDNEEKTLTGNYTATANDESIILVKNSGNLTLNNAVATKTAGDSSNTENSEFYGINAGILVTANSTANITNTQISTNAKGSNAVFSTGTDSKIYLTNTKINTTGAGSARGLDATYGGYIEADNATINTQGNSCATLATDRGEGTVIAKNSALTTNGVGSPIIYSTGDISIYNTKGTANNSQLVVIEGKNSATVDNSELKCSGKGNRNNVDNCGIMVYQSMSGDANQGTGTLNIKNSTLEINSDSNYYNTAPFFFITNTKGIINLQNSTLKYGSNILMNIQGTNEWGHSGQNGGDVTLNTSSQNLTGDIKIDNISTLQINLNNSSTFNGTINNQNTAKNVVLNIDKTSTLTLTEDTYLTSLTNEDSSSKNINFNGYKLYVNGIPIN